MALISIKTSSATRSTRVSRTSSGSTTSKVTTSSTTVAVTKQAASARAPRALANNEKENIDPLTGLDTLQSNKKKSKSALGASNKTNTTTKSEFKPALDSGRAGPVTRSQTSPPPSSEPSGQMATGQRRTRQSTVGTSKQSRRSDTRLDAVAAEVDILHGAIDALISKRAPKVERDTTLADRVLAAKQHETAADRRAREFTVMPLADLSEAFQLPRESTSQSRAEVEALLTQTEAAETSETPNLFSHELSAVLRRLVADPDTHALTPTVLKTRGVKRSIDSLRTAAASPSVSRRASTGEASSRPTKRLRTSAFAAAPPNSPVRSHAVALPAAEADNASSFVEEDSYDKTQDETQGSSHYSSVLDSLSFRAGASFDSLLLQDLSFESQL